MTTPPAAGAGPAVPAAAAGWRRAELAYCSNVHPGTGPDALAGHLRGPIRAVRERRGLGSMAAGLWLPAAAARALDPAGPATDPGRLAGLLADAGLALRTLNGFPFGDFHGDRVKEAVYRPAWDRPERLDYTLSLARVLARCLDPTAAEGTISTLPLGFAAGWSPDRHVRALEQLCRLAAGLQDLAGHGGRPIRVCLEPEPDCVIETTDQAIRLFGEELPAAARLAGVPADALRDHLGLCFDVCHQAVQFEDPAESLGRLAAAGVRVAKIQVSSALEVRDPARADLADALAPFAEPRYLHQVRCRDADGRLHGRRDLPDALADGFARSGPWRIHFHVPIQHAAAAGGIGTTRDAILRTLDHLAAVPAPRPHLEVETYTWLVLPPARRPRDQASLVAGLAGELAWLEREMTRRGLLAG